MPVARPRGEFELVKRLVASGLSSREVADTTGIPYGTVRIWRRRTTPPLAIGHLPLGVPLEAWAPPDGAAYAYLLGIYLGDGCLNRPQRGCAQLVITLDDRYPRVIAEVADAVRYTVPVIRVRSAQRPGCTAILASHPVWRFAFPQDGPGRKHKRKIRLEDWQREISHEHPKALIRGLIHSDGSRCVNRFKVKLPSGRVGSYAYVRYFFTNYSADIRSIFCEHCDLLGIRWTQSSFKNISIAHRDSVALLDSFVGPKG
jgi:hypothetical protein